MSIAVPFPFDESPPRRPFGVLVTGSRDWPDRQFVWNALDFIRAQHRDLVVWHGNCPDGADAAAKAWCEVRFVGEQRFNAQWQLYGKSAGPRRNETMVSQFATAGRHGHDGQVALAFRRGGEASRGTTGCIKILRAAGYDPTIYEFEDIYS